MVVLTYLYNSESAPDHVGTVVERLDDGVETVDVAQGADARREAMFALRESVRIGDNPDAIYDDDGTPTFAPGVLVTEDERGRRALHVGADALDALDGDDC
jgi:hypothetical protein